MIWRPRCIMNPFIEPAEPITMIVPPFWSMPVRAPTRPLITRSPPRNAAPVREPAFAVDHDDARHHVLARRPADATLDVHLGAVDDAAAEVAEAAVEGDLAACEDADAERMLGARVPHRDVGDALLVDQPAQLEVDLPGRQVVRVELGRGPVDLGDLRYGRVRLGKAARVVADRVLAYRSHVVSFAGGNASGPEAGFAGREAHSASGERDAEGGGSWGNHGFPHACYRCHTSTSPSYGS